MDTCSNDADIISELWCLQSRFLESLNSGLDAYKAVAEQLKASFVRARQCLVQSHSPTALAQVMAVVARTCLTYIQLEEDNMAMEENLSTSIKDVFSRAGLRRRRKRSTRSHKSKAGKCGRVRRSGKKSKRGHKSPVGNPKRRTEAEAGSSKAGSSKRKSMVQDQNSKKSRNVTAPPTDSMKFGPCRDFFLSHLGDPYPTTVQKHQILKLSSPDFTLRSLNLWFVNIRRRSKWMDIFKKHAGSKRDAMRDLVARVEAQVAGRPAPNPLPSGAAPPGCKVDNAIVEEVMAMRAVVDMVSREVYGEGWDQILQIRPWTDEEVRAHEERKKASRREARAAKADQGKRKQDREAMRLQRKQERERRKTIEQEAVDGIRAARELHAKLMSMNKRKRDDDESESSSKRFKSGKDMELDENNAKKRKVKVPKYDDSGNPLSKEQRKAIKRAIIAAQTQSNPLKRKSPELNTAGPEPSLDDAPANDAPSKRRRRDAVTFEGFPAPGAATEAEGMADLTQLFSLEWASPPAQPTSLPPAPQNPPPATPQPGYGGFALPSDHQSAPTPSEETAGEVPRRFSQQLAAFALESGMFDNQNFELFTSDTFPGMEVDVHPGNAMPSGSSDMPNNNSFGPGIHNHVPEFAQQSTLHLNTNTSAAGSMSVSPNQSQIQTPMQQFSTPTQHHAPPFGFAPPNDHSHTMHDSHGFGSANDSSQHSNADSSDMSWINAALEHLPSQQDVARMNNNSQFPNHGTEFAPQVHNFSNQYSSQHAPEFESRPSTAVSDWHEPVQSQRMSHTPNSSQSRAAYPSATSPPTPMAPPQARPVFPQPQSKPAPPQPQTRPPSAQPPSKPRAPGSLWQTPHSQQSQPRYATPGPSTYSQPPASYPAPAPPHSFPSPVTPHYPPPPQFAPAQYNERPSERRDVAPSPDNAAYSQRCQPEPTYQEPPQPSPAPKPLLKDREAEFARAQEALQAQFRKEQEEQLARFMRAQEELRNQLLGAGGRS